MKLYELTIDDLNQHGVFIMSLVENPAIEINYVTLSKDKLTLAKLIKEQQIIVGPALIPDKQILRREEKTGEEYAIYFTAETVKEAAHLYLKRNSHHTTNLEHDVTLGGISAVESWIVEDPENDKSKVYGFDVPKGTWMLAMKVDNQDIWDNYVKTETVKGFSIEGEFLPKLTGETEMDVILKAIDELLRE